VADEDQGVMASISRLSDEEHELWRREADGSATHEDRERLRQLEVELDQCWDLLRQRRARRLAGLDPDGASVRDEDTVEGYRQ
jgi:Protein of unknown function (DUF2630)